MGVTHAPKEADSVKELEDLDRTLAAQPGRVAKARGEHLAVALRDAARQVGQLLHHLRVIEEVLDDLEHLAALGQARQHASHLRFGQPRGACDVAHPRRIEPALKQHRQCTLRHDALGFAQLHAVFWYMHKARAARELALGHQLLQQRGPQRLGHARQRQPARALHIRPDVFGVPGVKLMHGRQHRSRVGTQA